jgi:hypothetical protein
MDLDIKLKAAIASVWVKVRDAERRIFIELEREFDHELADAFNARPMFDLVLAGRVDVASSTIDAVVAIGTLKAGKEKVRIPELVGVKFKARKGKENEDGPDEPPYAVLTFECKYNRDAWVFLGEAQDAIADITIRSVQRALPLPGEAPAPKKGRKAKAAKEQTTIPEALPS